MRGSEAYGEGGVLAALRALALGARSEFSAAAGRRRLTSQKITNALATFINPQEIYTDLDARARWN